MPPFLRAAALVALLLGAGTPVLAQPAALAEGSRQLVLHGRDGSRVVLGQVRFGPATGGRTPFTLALDHKPFQDHFLSMKEFKCVDGQGEILCHVPYPYPQPGSVAPDDLAWLEHALLFMFKTPKEFGAKLWNGVYFRLAATPSGTLEGRPQAIDLNRISAPPSRPGPPFGPAQRDDIPPGTRWFERLTIE